MRWCSGSQTFICHRLRRVFGPVLISTLSFSPTLSGGSIARISNGPNLLPEPKKAKLTKQSTLLAPRIRYNVHDAGGIMTLAEMKDTLAKYDVELNADFQTASKEDPDASTIFQPL